MSKEPNSENLVGCLFVAFSLLVTGPMWLVSTQ